jgi:hypothetical protein
MARFRAGPLVAAVSGVIGGVEFAQGKTSATVKLRRRSARTPSPRQTLVIASVQSFNSFYDAATPALRQAWASFAAAYPITDRLGERRQWTGRQAALRFHQIMWDSFDRPSLEGSILQYPPPLGWITKLFTSVSIQFTAGGPYIVNAVAPLQSNTYTALYAARTWSGSKGGCSTMLFIGGRRAVSGPSDWYAYFTRPSVAWELIPGEHITILVRNMRLYPYYWPNYRWESSGVIA